MCWHKPVWLCYDPILFRCEKCHAISGLDLVWFSQTKDS